MPALLSPLFLLAALAAAVPVVLHLLKREQEPRVKFAAVALLRHAPVDRSSTRRLRNIVLLMLRVAALVLLAVAFARPFLKASAAAASNATIVALDTSYSLSAPGRFARAQELAREAVRRAPAGDDVGVVTFADRADLIVSPSASRAAALAGIDSAAAGSGGTRYLSAVNVAARAFGTRRGTIVVVTDLQAGGWDAGDHASIGEAARVEIRDVGALPDNVAATGLRAEGDRAIVTIRNDSAKSREAVIRLTVDGRAAGEKSVTVGSHASADATFTGVTVSSGSGGEAVASVVDREGLQADNVRYALFSRASAGTVLAVTATGDPDRDAFYVRQAFASRGTSRGVSGISGSQLGTWSDGRIGSYTAVLLLSTRGLDRRGRDLLTSYVTAGGGLLVAAGPDVDGDVAADVLGTSARLRMAAPAEQGRPGQQSLAPADIRHPIFQPFGPAAGSLGLVRFSRAATIVAAGCQTLATFTSGEPAAIDCAIGRGRAIVIASDLNNHWNDFPLHATFVPFLHEAIRYLSSARSRAGEYVVSEVPAGVPPAPGIVTIGDAAGSGRAVINVDPAEADPARISPAEFDAAIARLKDAGVTEARSVEADRESPQHLWQYVLAAMMVVLAAEGVVAARTA